MTEEEAFNVEKTNASCNISMTSTIKKEVFAIFVFWRGVIQKVSIF